MTTITTATTSGRRHLSTLSLSLLLSLISAAAANDGGVTYSVTNNAAQTKGGLRFRYAIGAMLAKEAMVSATSFIWLTLNQTNSPGERKSVRHVTLFIDAAMDGAASYTEDSIHVSAAHIATYEGDVARELIGLIYHEMAHVWQWNGGGQAPPGLVTGMADFVRLKAGYAPGYWVGPGNGERWDEGYVVTARFLDYCEGLRSGFVAELNKEMRFEYKQRFFKHLIGRSVHDLWVDYKNKYKG